MSVEELLRAEQEKSAAMGECLKEIVDLCDTDFKIRGGVPQRWLPLLERARKLVSGAPVEKCGASCRTNFDPVKTGNL